MSLGERMRIGDKLQFYIGHLSRGLKVPHLQLGQTQTRAGFRCRLAEQCLSAFKVGLGVSIISLLQQDSPGFDLAGDGFLLTFSVLRGDGGQQKEKTGDYAVKRFFRDAVQMFMDR